MYNNAQNKIEEIRSNPMDELAYMALEIANNDKDKAIEYFYSMSFLIPKENTEKNTKEKSKSNLEEIKKELEEIGKEIEELEKEMKMIENGHYF